MPETGISEDRATQNGPSDGSSVVHSVQNSGGLRAEFTTRLKAAHRLAPGASGFSKSLMALLGDNREG